jgi:hypothetical protein
MIRIIALANQKGGAGKGGGNTDSDRIPYLPCNREHHNYLLNSGVFEKAQMMAAHESPRTAKLYDRTSDG